MVLAGASRVIKYSNDWAKATASKSSNLERAQLQESKETNWV